MSTTPGGPDDLKTLKDDNKRRIRLQLPIMGIQMTSCEEVIMCYIIIFIALAALTIFFMFGNLTYIAINTECYCKREDGLRLKVHKYEGDHGTVVECKYYAKNNNGKWIKIDEKCYKDFSTGEVGSCERGRAPVDQKCKNWMALYLSPIPIIALCFLCCTLSIPYFGFITMWYNGDKEKNIEVLWPCIFGWPFWPCVLIGVPIIIFVIGLCIIVGVPIVLIGIVFILPFMIAGLIGYFIFKNCRCAPCATVSLTKTVNV